MARLHTMTNKTLARRLERLEARLLPATEERVIILNLVSADGEIVDTSKIKLYSGPPLVRKGRRWSR
jgi:hypothetical protein